MKMNNKPSTKFCMLKNLTLTTDDHRGQIIVKEQNKEQSSIDVHLFFSMQGSQYACDYYGIGDVRDEGKYTRETHFRKVDIVLPADATLLKTFVDENGNKHSEKVSAGEVAEDRTIGKWDLEDTARYLDYFENKKTTKEEYTKNIISDLVQSSHGNDNKETPTSDKITIQRTSTKKENLKSGISSVFTKDNIPCKSRRKTLSSKEATKHFWESERFDIPCLRIYEGKKGPRRNDITITQIDENRKQAQLYFWVDNLHLRGSFTEPIGMITDNNEKDRNGRHICTVTLPSDFEFTVIGHETDPNEYGATEIINLDKEHQQKISVKTVYELRENKNASDSGHGSKRNGLDTILSTDSESHDIEDFGV